MKLLKKIKIFDLFRVTKNFNLEKNTLENTKNCEKSVIPTDNIGSELGGCASIILVVCILA